VAATATVAAATVAARVVAATAEERVVVARAVAEEAADSEGVVREVDWAVAVKVVGMEVVEMVGGLEEEATVAEMVGVAMAAVAKEVVA
jgi:hypothetical protein